MLKNILKVLVLIFLSLFLWFSQSHAKTELPSAWRDNIPGHKTSENPGMAKLIEFFEGVSWCCAFETIGQHCPDQDISTAVNRILGCYFSNSGLKTLVELPTTPLHRNTPTPIGNRPLTEKQFENKIWRMVWDIVLKAGFDEVSGKILSFPSAQPNPDYMLGKESYRLCYDRLKNDYWRPQCEEDSVLCSLSILPMVPYCDNATRQDLEFMGRDNSFRGSTITTIDYSLVSNQRGLVREGQCEGSICNVTLPADQLHPGESFTASMIGHTRNGTCRAQASANIPGGQPEVFDLEFNLDPLVYNVKGMSRETNPYNDTIVSTYDDLLLRFKIRGVNRESARRIIVDYTVSDGTSDGSIDSGLLTLGGLERRQWNKKLEEDWQGAFYLTEEVYSTSPQPLKRDQPRMHYDACQIEATVPVINALTHRGQKWVAHVQVKIKADAERSPILLADKNFVLNVADYNFIFTKSSFFNDADFFLFSTIQFQKFFELARQTGGSLQDAKQIKLIFRDVCNIDRDTIDDLPSCVRAKKEIWNPRDTLAHLHPGSRGFGKFNKGIIIFSNDSEWILAHEMGHTYGLCDEYQYGCTPGLEQGCYKGQNEYTRCPNPYPLCGNDHPNNVTANKQETNNCYNKQHAELGRDASGPWYTDTLPQPDHFNLTAGSMLGCTQSSVWACGGASNKRRSVMGAATNYDHVRAAMANGEVELAYPENFLVPNDAIRGPNR